jgi:two-component system, sensor histidine kinase and response regulator
MTDNAAFDRVELGRQMADDETLIADVIRLFLDDCPTRLAEIRAAITAQNAEQLRTTAHALKGAAGYMAAARVVAAAAALEVMGREGRLSEAPEAFSLLEAESAQLLAELRVTLPRS